MPRADGPSYADLVYEVLKTADKPLTFQEIFERVDRRRPVTTRNPKATIRNALTQGRQLVNLGDGRYGYLPNLLPGSLLRLPLTEKKPAHHALVYPGELRDALWPSFFEIQKRRVIQPVQARLPSGDHVSLVLEFLGVGVWGTAMPEGLRQYLIEHRAAAGDSLLVRVIDVEAGRCDITFEARRRRNEGAVASRNRELTDAVYSRLRQHPTRELPIWNLGPALLARGFYRADVAPDPLTDALGADSRFVHTGLSMWVLAEEMTPEMWTLVEDRKRLETEMLAFGEGTPAGTTVAQSPLALRARMEQALADIGAALADQEFESIEDANAFLRELNAGGGPPRRPARTPLERAQQLVYDAWESPSPRDRIRLAREALQISPDCADAYVLLADETARTPKRAAELYAEGVAAGRRALGAEAIELYAGQFWGIPETRPFMRALWGLAEARWTMGERQEAIGHAWELLRLNPNDNQGVRYELLCWLLRTGDDLQVEKLLDRYRGDVAALWTYGRALHAFRRHGETARARKLLAEATAANPYVPAYLLGRKRVPNWLPDTVGLGDETEAVDCAAGQLEAWRGTPGALAWLDVHAPRDAGR